MIKTHHKAFGFITTFLILIILMPAIASADWEIESVDTAKEFAYQYDRAIAIDRVTDQPHIVYGYSELYHTWFDGTQWHHETVDSTLGVGKYASIALDSQSNIYICYYDSTNNDLKFATNVSGSWVISTIDSVTGFGMHASIVVDSSNNVHISYRDYYYSDKVLKYATNASGSWVISTLDSNNVGEYSSIAVDSNDKVHIAYYDDSDDDLKYVTNASGSWIISTVDSSSIDGYSSIALDSNGTVHISYVFDNGVSSAARYATNDSGWWDVSTIESASTVGYIGYYDTSIAIDSNNRAHISYYDATNDDLKYATNSSGSWVTSEKDSSGDVGSSSSIALDSNNKVHISYYDRTNNDLKHITNTSGSWFSSIIESSRWVGQYSSIAIDSNIKAHISHYDGSDLRYSTNVSGAWSTSIIDSSGNVGKYSSLALDSNNKVHISYYDSTNGDLRYSTNVSGTWSTSTIDSSGDLGQYSSIALDSNNKVHISYYDSTNGDLKYATNVSGTWSASVIDSSGDVGQYSSIALDSNNKVHISYYFYDRISYGNLKYMSNSTGSWVALTIDSAGSPGYYTSIALDSNNKVHISYFVFIGSDLKYATNASGVWVISTLESEGSVGFYTSIALDSNNKVHISYFSSTGSDLKYATNASGAWVISALDTVLQSGMYTSIALDAYDNMHISYRESYYSELKYATTYHEEADAIVSPVSISFGSVMAGTYSEETITVSNDGFGDLIMGSIALADPVAAPFSIVSDNCSGLTVSPGGGCTITVRFEPGTIGSYSDTFDIPSNDPDESPVTINISGTGQVPYPYISVSPVLIDIGSVLVGESFERTIDVWNDGTEDLTIGSIGLADPATAPFSIVSDNCSGITFPPGTGCTLTVSFATATEGSFSDTFDIPSNDPYENPVTVSLTGSGEATFTSLWNTRIIDSSGTFGEYTTIGLDSLNKVHVSYKNTDLMHATNASGSWVTETVDPYGINPSLAVDSTDNLHISYHVSGPIDPCHDRPMGSLKYASDAGGPWVLETIHYGSEDCDNVRKVGPNSSIAVDSSDVLHISYNIRTFRDWSCTTMSLYCHHLYYATNASGFWEWEIIDYGNTEEPFKTVESDVAVDSMDKVHISYGVNSLKYTTNASGSWIIETLDNSAAVGRYNSIAIDSSNRAHISYYDVDNGDLKYATNVSGQWVTSVIDVAGNVGMHTSIAVDSFYRVHISYYDKTNGDLKYATNSTGPWVTRTLYSEGDAGSYTSIAVDTNDRVHISFLESTNDSLLYVTNATTNLAPEIAVSPVALNFLAVITGSGSEKTLTIQNAGTENLSVGSIATADPLTGPFNITTDNCSGMTLTAGDGCTLTVRFTPAADGNYSDSFDIPSNDPDDNPVTVTVSGYGVTSDEDFETGDLSSFPWVTGGDGIWTVQQAEKHSGSYAAEAPLISNLQSSYLEVTLTVLSSGEVSFWHKTFSNYSFNELTFRIDNAYRGSWDGETDWAKSSYAVSPGLHTFRWEYKKTYYYSGESDTAWIDDINFLPYELPDADGDGYTVDMDCDDSNAALNPETFWYPDSDGDGFGNPTVSVQQCSQFLDYVLNDRDCDDSDANLYFGGPQVRITGSPHSYFETFQEAYLAASWTETDHIQTKGTRPEDLLFNLNKTVIMDGGYDCSFTKTGRTIVYGTVEITDGVVTMGDYDLR